ncbi:hypothetical protein [Alicyclobacillus sp.]|uniref:hypothetical protein n=1 Tax=Alicyclobacillus sp. TaxID=61169 RepID=UPI0025C03B71|nr:hypothetical protein [Alicyclobacillus sp.]MCL6516785.1 hypothetical protein [Alicyclobacillus sp.]
MKIRLDDLRVATSAQARPVDAWLCSEAARVLEQTLGCAVRVAYLPGRETDASGNGFGRASGTDDPVGPSDGEVL